MKNFYLGFILLIISAICIELLVITQLYTLFGILIAVLAITGFLLTQFSQTAMKYLDGLLLLIFQLIFTSHFFITIDIAFGGKVIN